MPNETGEIRHQLLTDFGDRLEAHGLYVAFIAFALLVVAALTALAVAEVLRDRRHARERQEAAQRAEATRSAGIAEGFRRGFHG